MEYLCEQEYKSMQLTLSETSPASLRAGYSCPCGCTPSVEYPRGAALVEEGCCCGNQFAVGPAAGAHLLPTDDFRSEFQTFAAPWGERLEAAWLVGPSTHGEHGHEHTDAGHDDLAGSAQSGHAIDPVCGMTVDPDSARGNGLHGAYKGTEYFFCGRGCKLDFEEDPERYLDPRRIPSM